MIEAEIRFSVPRDHDATVKEHFPDAAEFNRAVYFDTPDHRLWKSGVECRIRENGNGRRQTVKKRIPGSPAFAREEREIPVESLELNVPHLEAVLPPVLRGEAARVAPVFSTDVKRSKRVIERRGNVVEAVHDRGRITANGKSVEIDDVEHELRRGAPRSLADACLAFLELAPCGLETQGKAARGFGLLTGEPPAPVPAETVRVPPSTAIPEAAAAMMRSAFAQILANHAALVQTAHPEAIHQMRVGLRRLRSTLSAFGPVLDVSGAAGMLAAAKSLFSRLGDVRDADVFAAETAASFPKDLLDGKVAKVLTEEVARFRERAFADVIDCLAGPEFARLAVRWHGWIEDGEWLRDERPVDRLLARRPVGEFAATRLASMHRRLVKRGRRALKGDIDDWHRARIAAKQARYAGAPLLQVLDEGGRGAGRYSKRLARLQDDLGKFNDMCNVAPFLRRVRETVPERATADFAEAAAFCSGWSGAEVARAVSRLGKSWKKFEAAQDGGLP